MEIFVGKKLISRKPSITIEDKYEAKKFEVVGATKNSDGKIYYDVIRDVPVNHILYDEKKTVWGTVDAEYIEEYFFETEADYAADFCKRYRKALDDASTDLELKYEYLRDMEDIHEKKN